MSTWSWRFFSVATSPTSSRARTICLVTQLQTRFCVMRVFPSARQPGDPQSSLFVKGWHLTRHMMLARFSRCHGCFPAKIPGRRLGRDEGREAKQDKPYSGFLSLPVTWTTAVCGQCDPYSSIWDECSTANSGQKCLCLFPG